MRSLYVPHHVCVTARPWWKCKSRTYAQRNPRRPSFEIQANLHNRRAALLSVASVLAAPACAFTSTSPYEDAKTMQYGLDNERSSTDSACFGNHSSALSPVTENCNARSERYLARQTYTYLSRGSQPKLRKHKKLEPGSCMLSAPTYTGVHR